MGLVSLIWCCWTFLWSDLNVRQTGITTGSDSDEGLLIKHLQSDLLFLLFGVFKRAAADWTWTKWTWWSPTDGRTDGHWTGTQTDGWSRWDVDSCRANAYLKLMFNLHRLPPPPPPLTVQLSGDEFRGSLWIWVRMRRRDEICLARGQNEMTEKPKKKKKRLQLSSLHPAEVTQV